MVRGSESSLATEDGEAARAARQKEPDHTAEVFWLQVCSFKVLRGTFALKGGFRPQGGVFFMNGEGGKDRNFDYRESAAPGRPMTSTTTQCAQGPLSPIVSGPFSAARRA